MAAAYTACEPATASCYEDRLSSKDKRAAMVELMVLSKAIDALNALPAGVVGLVLVCRSVAIEVCQV